MAILKWVCYNMRTRQRERCENGTVRKLLDQNRIMLKGAKP